MSASTYFCDLLMYARQQLLFVLADGNSFPYGLCYAIHSHTCIKRHARQQPKSVYVCVFVCIGSISSSDNNSNE